MASLETEIRRAKVRRFKSLALTGIIAIGGGLRHSIALKNDGTVWAWGDNGYGQLGTGNNASQNIPVQISNFTDVTAIAVGDYHSMALKSDGTVWNWGNNSNGQLGDGGVTNQNTPIQVTG